MNWVVIFLILAVAFFAVAGIRSLIAKPGSFDFVTWGLFCFAFAFLVPHLQRIF